MLTLLREINAVYRQSAPVFNYHALKACGGNGGTASHIPNFSICLLIYQSNFTSTKTYTHPTLLGLLHVSAHALVAIVRESSL